MVNYDVEVGDKIYVGGIYGDDFKMFNNKVGKVDAIIFNSNQFFSTYLVDVVVNKTIFPVNLSYIYKLNDLDTYDYGDLLEDEEPLNHYFNKHNITGEAVIKYDEDGLNQVVCKTNKGIGKVFYLTSIN